MSEFKEACVLKLFTFSMCIKEMHFLFQVLNACVCICVSGSGVLVYVSIDLWWAARRGVGGRQSGRAQKGSHRKEKEDISMELVTTGRGWAPIQLAWRLYQRMCVTGGLGGALHCAAPCASKAEASRCDLPHRECCGISTPPWHVFSFAAMEILLLLLTLCVCFDTWLMLLGCVSLCICRTLHGSQPVGRGPEPLLGCSGLKQSTTKDCFTLLHCAQHINIIILY